MPANTLVEKKRYGARKACSRCDRSRVISKFRLLSSGYRQGMCCDCERDYERDRWHTRSEASRASSGGSSSRRQRRHQLAAA